MLCLMGITKQGANIQDSAFSFSKYQQVLLTGCHKIVCYIYFGLGYLFLETNDGGMKKCYSIII